MTQYRDAISGTTQLEALQARYSAPIEHSLVDWIDRRVEPAALRGMLLYQLGHADSNFDRVSSVKGKRFRPILCLSGCQAAGGHWAEALNVAAAIELLHNFSLIHDDIEDRDPTRHHRPTVWVQWGEPDAINAGDAMFALAGRAVAEAVADPVMHSEIVSRFLDVTLDLTRGQFLDMSFERRPHVSVTEYETMIELKTAALIAFSLWSGASVAGAGLRTRNHLCEGGISLGKSFQVFDDIRGMWAPSDVTGKEVAKDLSNRKKTLPVLLARESASSAQVTILDRFMAGDSDDHADVLDVLESTGAHRLAGERAAGFLQQALDSFAQAGLDATYATELVNLARELTGSAG